MKIELSHITKEFDGNELFSIDHFIFESGKVYGLIGPNGAGKTTLLRILGGFDRAFTGQARYDDTEYSDLLVKRMSYIYQQPYMLNRNVFENLAYPLRVRNYDQATINREVEIWLEKLGIEHLRNRKAKVLSAGEQQKVALARGLIYEPDLVLLDEPTANIDPDTVEVLESMIASYQKKTQATLIWVTHNLRQAWKNCDQVAVLQNDQLKWMDKNALQKGAESAMRMEMILKT